MLNLVSVYGNTYGITGFLYDLLQERKDFESISHKSMPTFKEHENFVLSKPYKAWYLIQANDPKYYPYVGAIYLSKDNEIGISILDKYRRKGYAEQAIKALMSYHKVKTYRANINPINHKSIDLFEKKLGFIYQTTETYPNNIIQHVYIKSVITGPLARRVKLNTKLFDGAE